MVEKKSYPVAPDSLPHPCLDGVICRRQGSPCHGLAHDPEEADILHQGPETEIRNLETEVGRLEAEGHGRCGRGGVCNDVAVSC